MQALALGRRETADGNGSISLNATASQPIPSNAQDAASMPEKMLMYLIRHPPI